MKICCEYCSFPGTLSLKNDRSLAIAGHPSPTKIAWLNLNAILSAPLIRLTNIPTKEKKFVNQTRDTVKEAASKLLDDSWGNVGEENGKRDVMSVLGKYFPHRPVII